MHTFPYTSNNGNWVIFNESSGNWNNNNYNNNNYCRCVRALVKK
jgi:hypothetical protein